MRFIKHRTHRNDQWEPTKVVQGQSTIHHAVKKNKNSISKKNQIGHSAPKVERLHEIRKKNLARRRKMVTQKRGNKRENESRKKQYDMRTLGGIKIWQGLMGHHINCTNWRWKRKSNGKYKTTRDALKW
jgi:hypothetical protein